MLEKGATSAVLIRFGGEENGKIPTSFVDIMGTKSALSVINHKEGVIKIFPLSNDEIYLLRVKIHTLSRDFLKQLNNVFNDTGLTDIVFTTGVCLRNDVCLYEAYFSSEHLHAELTDIKPQIMKIPGTTDVIIKKV